MNLPVQISYHYPCPDGVFAALAAHLRFSVAAQKVVWIPNAVYAPKQLQDLQLQVTCLDWKKQCIVFRRTTYDQLWELCRLDNCCICLTLQDPLVLRKQLQNMEQGVLWFAVQRPATALSFWNALSVYGTLKAASAVLAFRVVVLDHHKTAMESLNTTESQHPNLDAQIDMSRSGATIALDYFKPEVLISRTTCLVLLSHLMHVICR